MTRASLFDLSGRCAVSPGRRAASARRSRSRSRSTGADIVGLSLDDASRDRRRQSRARGARSTPARRRHEPPRRPRACRGCRARDVRPARRLGQQRRPPPREAVPRDDRGGVARSPRRQPVRLRLGLPRRRTAHGRAGRAAASSTSAPPRTCSRSPTSLRTSPRRAASSGSRGRLPLELAPHGITVNAIAPGATDTPLNATSYTPEVRAAYEKRISLGHIADPAEIGDAAVFLACDASRYVTGTSCSSTAGSRSTARSVTPAPDDPTMISRRGSPTQTSSRPPSRRSSRGACGRSAGVDVRVGAASTSGCSRTAASTSARRGFGGHHSRGSPRRASSASGPREPRRRHGLGQRLGRGLVTTCGLSNVGRASEGHGLHGTYTARQATDIHVERSTSDVTVTRHRRGSTLHAAPANPYDVRPRGPRCRRPRPNGSAWTAAAPLLYHVNIGAPLWDGDAFLETDAREVVPRDDDAAAELDTWDVPPTPAAGAPNVSSSTLAPPGRRLTSPRFGIEVTVRSSLPRLWQWVHPATGTNALAIEPANCSVLGRAHDIGAGQMPFLDPGEHRSTWLAIEAASVARRRAKACERLCSHTRRRAVETNAGACCGEPGRAGAAPAARAAP